MVRTLIALPALLALPAAAGGATVQTRVEPGLCPGKYACDPDILRVTYTAQPGEENRLRVRLEAPRTVVLEDDGAPIQGDSRCASRSAHAVACELAAVAIAAGRGRTS